MTTLFLIRHGETDAVGNSIMGWLPGCHLNPTGKAQAEQLAQRLSRYPIRAIYTSPLERAVETAQPLAGRLGLELHRSNELGELHVGAWEGLSFQELEGKEEWRRFNAFRSGTRAPQGELMIEAQVRMVRQLECFQQRHSGEYVAVVSHADPLRAALAHYAGIPIDLALRLEISPTSVSVVELTDWAPRILCINSTGDVPQ